MKKAYWFEDVEPGMTISTSLFKVTQENIGKFAEAGGDLNPLHLDPEYASRRIPFRKIIAHGELMAAIITGESAKIIGYESIILHTKTETEFKDALFPGDLVYVMVEIEEKEDKGPRKGLIKVRGKLINQKNKIIAVGARELLIFKKPKRSE